MVENIKKNWHLNLNKSFMIGDKLSDKKCAEKSNLNFHYPTENILKKLKNIL